MDSDQHLSTQMRVLDDLMARLQRIMVMNSHDFPLTASQIFILRYLDRCGQAKASDIAKIAGLSPGAVTQVCDELVRQGFVERTRSSDDRRVVHVAMTDKGKLQLEDIRKVRSKSMERILSRFDERELDEFTRLVGRIVDIVETDVRGTGK